MLGITGCVLHYLTFVVLCNDCGPRRIPRMDHKRVNRALARSLGFALGLLILMLVVFVFWLGPLLVDTVFSNVPADHCIASGCL